MVEPSGKEPTMTGVANHERNEFTQHISPRVPQVDTWQGPIEVDITPTGNSSMELTVIPKGLEHQEIQRVDRVELVDGVKRGRADQAEPGDLEEISSSQVDAAKGSGRTNSPRCKSSTMPATKRMKPPYFCLCQNTKVYILILVS